MDQQAGFFEMEDRSPGEDVIRHGQWSNGWEDLGGSIKDSPSAVSWLPGFLEVFTRDTNNHLTYELYGGGFWSGWGAPTNFTLTTAPAAVAVPGSTVHVFTTSGKDLLRLTDSPVGNPNGWSSDWVHYSCDCIPTSLFGPAAVVFTTHLVSGPNIAPLASASASSENAGSGQQANKAIDGVINGFPIDPTREWATINGGAGSWLQLNWPSPQSVTGIVLYDRPNLNDQITGGSIQFSDGAVIGFQRLPNGGNGAVFTFPAKTITSLRLNVTTVSDTTTNVGLAEIQVYGETLPTPTPRPPRPTPTPQPTPTRIICRQPPCHSTP
jgi:F5/8 type C domain